MSWRPRARTSVPYNQPIRFPYRGTISAHERTGTVLSIQRREFRTHSWPRFEVARKHSLQEPKLHGAQKNCSSGDWLMTGLLCGQHVLTTIMMGSIYTGISIVFRVPVFQGVVVWLLSMFWTQNPVEGHLVIHLTKFVESDSTPLHSPFSDSLQQHLYPASLTFSLLPSLTVLPTWCQCYDHDH